MSKTIVLIGGMPTVGKSTVAQALSKHLDLPWLSSDQIRTVMSSVAKRNDYPDLFTPEGYDGERFLNEFSPLEIARMEAEQGEVVWLGIKAFIENDYIWRKGFIIEGVSILPRLVAKDYKDESEVKSVFLVDNDEERIRKVVFSRGLWGDPNEYPDYVKEKEVEWVLEFSKNLEQEALKYSLPLVAIQKDESDLQSVLKALGLRESS